MLMATVRLAGAADQRLRIRDISAGGLKVTSALKPARGTKVHIELLELGWVTGEIAWATESTFGVRLVHRVDPAAARQRVSGDFTVARPAPRLLRCAG